MTRAVLAAVTVILFGLVTAAAAEPASAPPSKQQIRFTAADQAAARAAVLRLTDLGSSGWQGGRLKPRRRHTFAQRKRDGKPTKGNLRR